MTPVFSSASLAARRPVLGSTTTDLPSHQQSEHLDLRRALHPSEVADVLVHLPGERATKAWHRLAPLLALYAGLTPPQIARLRTDDLSFVHGHGWLTVPRSDSPDPDHWPSLCIPLHTELVACRFHGFVHSRYFAEGGEAFLFPDLADAARPGDAIESWLRRTLRPLARDGGHAPTMRDLRATAALAALEGGAPVHMVEAWLGAQVPLWDDRGPVEPEGRERIQSEWIWEAVEAVAYPPSRRTSLCVSLPNAEWRPLLECAEPIVLPRLDASTRCGGAS